jgi:hypothetical protein
VLREQLHLPRAVDEQVRVACSASRAGQQARVRTMQAQLSSDSSSCACKGDNKPQTGAAGACWEKGQPVLDMLAVSAHHCSRAVVVDRSQ